MWNRLETWVALLALIRLAPIEPAKRLSAPVHSRRRISWRRWLFAAALGALAVAVAVEIRQSHLQAGLFSDLAGRMTFRVEPGRSDSIGQAPNGPYDQRLGYARLPAMIERLQDAGFTAEAQARWSPELASWVEKGLFPVYEEKTQAGFTLLDRKGVPLYAARYPQRTYTSFDEIPALVFASLLYIENREMLDRRYVYRNPAIEWDRLTKAGWDLGLSAVFPSHPVSGGSTLATQLEKLRHSEDGRTGGVREKLRQITTASLRAYREGPRTLEAQERIITDYLNSIPLAAIAGYGEVIGLGDGLWAWFGADFERVNRLLQTDEEMLSKELRAEGGRAYRQVLTLLLALRRPTHYLIERPHELNARADAYLRVLARDGVISASLRDEALRHVLAPRDQAPSSVVRPSFAERKATDAVRARTAALLGVSDFYELDRLDLAADSTLDGPATSRAVDFLMGLSGAHGVREAGLLGRQLLQEEDPAAVVYSFTLYERGRDANRLRVQADTWDGPFNVNDGTLLELGSTAKLRTLASYIEIIEELHRELTGSPAAERSAPAEDALSRWAASYLAAAEDESLEAMLEAAMQRQYSASPYETFFTGGGVHRFSNFDAKDNGQIMTVREAFQRSVNLVFIRMMRDIVRYYAERAVAGRADVLDDPASAARRKYLERFADLEGSHFLSEFFQKHKRLGSRESLNDLAARARGSLTKLAVVFRTTRPNAGRDSFSGFLEEQTDGAGVSAGLVDALYERYGPEKFSLADQGYLARIHPLELWVAEYLARRPDATWEEVAEASADERQAVYVWLFRTRHKAAQDKRIRIVMEIDAFEELHRRWRWLGYPFDSLTPSYATAIGSSGDRPEALAELVGIIVNEGVRRPLIRVDALHFAADTPYEARLSRRFEGRVHRVMHRAVAEVLQRELIGVVEEGTGRRAKGSVVISDGTPLPLGGKTGTGDNRVVTVSIGGHALESRPLNRTGTFVFFVGDRFFGVVTAFVPGRESARYQFTSALPVQVFKGLVPTFRDLLDVEPEGKHIRAWSAGDSPTERP
ncbi:MAG TPA: transglycosylase domain-containing protein [Bryobacterales bacterium]|nr:transglycosylase domain-containing protein [Bryobacterales bacterium]